MTRRADLLTRARADGRPLTAAEGKKLFAPKPLSEHIEQCWLVELVRAAEPSHHVLRMFFAVPNEGGQGVAGMIRSKMMKAEGASAGYPDMGLDSARGGYFGFRLEMKRSADFNWPKEAPYARGMPSPEQEQWHHQLADEGYCVCVAWGTDAAWAALSWYVALEPTARDGYNYDRMSYPSEITPARPPALRGIRWLQS